ncbi:MAG: hypothetical protein EZS28_003387 [Streblomastix strix]|uniref:Uncharacterized protein n=1 Tax=Streblomastix strix TaxID=222440 RepID=A0A5J4X2V5_9EUKA|nr:MAG: hypothetical protein EZS28_003387 [Streblomastix strix]
MRLLTHNIMQCVSPTCMNQHRSLKLQATKVEISQNEYDNIFTQRMIGRIDYDVLLEAYKSIIQNEYPILPPIPPQDIQGDDNFMKAMFFAIQTIIIVEGEMRCPQCGHIYIIHDTIPNMIIREMNDTVVEQKGEDEKVEDGDNIEDDKEDEDNDSKDDKEDGHNERKRIRYD